MDRLSEEEVGPEAEAITIEAARTQAQDNGDQS